MRDYIVDPFETMPVTEIMAQPVDCLPAGMTVGDAVAFFTAPDAPARHKSYPVTDGQNRLVAMVSRADALRWTRDDAQSGTTLGDMLGDSEAVIGFDDEMMAQLADRMAATDVGRVPILKRADRTVVGLAARRDLLRVRAKAVRQEQERETLIRFRSGKTAPA